jgi:hypothetical protein
MDDHGSTDDGGCGVAAQGGVHHRAFQVRVALCIGGQVAQVTGVVVFAHGATVLFLGGVEMTAGGFEIGGGQVAFLVDVESVLAVGGEAVDIGDEFQVVAVNSEDDGAGDIVVGAWWLIWMGLQWLQPW